MATCRNWDDLLGYEPDVALVRASGRTNKGNCPKALKLNQIQFPCSFCQEDPKQRGLMDLIRPRTYRALRLNYVVV